MTGHGAAGKAVEQKEEGHGLYDPFYFIGLRENVVNCEQMMALCRDAGYELREDPVGCDVAVVNTCAFSPVPTRRPLSISCGWQN